MHLGGTFVQMRPDGQTHLAQRAKISFFSLHLTPFSLLSLSLSFYTSKVRLSVFVWACRVTGAAWYRVDSGHLTLGNW